MRLYSMYVLCKSNIGFIKNVKGQGMTTNSGTFVRVNNWLSCIEALDKLANIPGLKESTTKFYESVPVILRGRDVFDLDSANYTGLDLAKKELLSSIGTIISMYEQMGLPQNTGLGFDIKLPQFVSIKDFSNCIKDLEFIVNQCPFLSVPDSEIKFKSADVGSFWITFLVAGTATSQMLLNLSKLVDAAVKIQSHVVTVKQQEEQLRSMELKNELTSELIGTFKKVNKSLVDKTVHELESDLGTLKDGEEVDKAGRSIEKLADWMNKGLQIYSAIDAPEEIKDLFPPQEEQQLLNDDIIKLLEQKGNSEQQS